MAHTVFHIENESPEFQAEVYKIIGLAADAGIQLTTLDFVNDGEMPTVSGMDAHEWLDAQLS